MGLSVAAQIIGLAQKREAAEEKKARDDEKFALEKHSTDLANQERELNIDKKLADRALSGLYSEKQIEDLYAGFGKQRPTNVDALIKSENTLKATIAESKKLLRDRQLKTAETQGLLAEQKQKEFTLQQQRAEDKRQKVKQEKQTLTAVRQKLITEGGNPDEINSIPDKDLRKMVVERQQEIKKQQTIDLTYKNEREAETKFIERLGIKATPLPINEQDGVTEDELRSIQRRNDKYRTMELKMLEKAPGTEKSRNELWKELTRSAKNKITEIQDLEAKAVDSQKKWKEERSNYIRLDEKLGQVQLEIDNKINVEENNNLKRMIENWMLQSDKQIKLLRDDWKHSETLSDNLKDDFGKKSKAKLFLDTKGDGRIDREGGAVVVDTKTDVPTNNLKNIYKTKSGMTATVETVPAG